MDSFNDSIVAIIAIVCMFGAPFIAATILGINWMRARHKERIGLINQGIIPPNETKKKSTPNRFVSLRNGIVLVALGIGIIVGFLCAEYLVIGQGNGFWMIASSIVFFLGLGYLVYFLVTQKMQASKQIDEYEQE
ncbi:MAG: hypothetical protein Q4G48_03780 [Bacteroidia bacterium]|nr:hypothetical protein [Bacteroidia bacterium]